MEQPLAGKRALVTGVSRRRGIGFAVADRLAALGADVFVQSWTPYDAARPWGADGDGVDALLRELRRHGTTVEHAQADLGETEAPAALIADAAATLGSPDILVANHTHSLTDRLEELTAAHIDDHLRINVRATLLLVKEFAARHDHSRPGRVIMLTSGQHLGPMPGELAYVASKGAIHQLTATLAAELMERGTTVNSVNPGPTDTGWADPSWSPPPSAFRRDGGASPRMQPSSSPGSPPTRRPGSPDRSSTLTAGSAADAPEATPFRRLPPPANARDRAACEPRSRTVTRKSRLPTVCERGYGVSWTRSPQAVDGSRCRAAAAVLYSPSPADPTPPRGLLPR